MHISVRFLGCLTALAVLGVGWLPGCGGGGGFQGNDGGASHDGPGSGPDGGGPPPGDGSNPQDGGPMTDGMAPGCDSGSSATMCGSAVAPSVMAGCASCGSMPCQPNGCYGGWWCDTATSKCEAPPTSCPPPTPCGGMDSGGPMDSGPGGPVITCPGPGSYTKNGSACGTERWGVKVGSDPAAKGLSLVPTPTTIGALTGAAANPGGYSTRTSPYETTLWELKDVTFTYLRLESDSDYHMVMSDGSNTMIVEIPYPDSSTCTYASAWECFISRARSEIDAKYTVSPSSQYPGVVVTVRGFGMFDSLHGQTGVAPNGIELHPVLQICFGKGCTPT